MDAAEEHRRSGNALLQRGDFADAAQHYDQGLVALLTSQERRSGGARGAWGAPGVERWDEPRGNDPTGWETAAVGSDFFGIGQLLNSIGVPMNYAESTELALKN